MRVKAYQRFKEFYLKLPSSIKKKVNKQIKLLAIDIRYPSLHCKKIQGHDGIWEARVDERYRMTFEIINDTLFLRAVADHDKALSHP